MNTTHKEKVPITERYIHYPNSYDKHALDLVVMVTGPSLLNNDWYRNLWFIYRSYEQVRSFGFELENVY
jgi:hypothetical protein